MRSSSSIREDEVQLAAIAAEINIFLAEKIVSRKRVGFIVEMRTPVAADAVFDSGPLAIGPRPVPTEVLDALRTAARDDNPRVRLEAMYAFGVLAVEPGGSRRREMLRTSGPDLAAMIGAVDPFHRYSALRVIGRVFERRLQDDPIDQYVGDAVIGVLNDRDKDDAVGRDAGARRHAVRTRGPGADGSVSVLRQGRHGRRGAGRDRAHRASIERAAAGLAAGLEERGAEGHRHRGSGARRRSRQAGRRPDRAEPPSGTTGLVLAGSFASAMLSDGPLDPIVEALAKSRLRDRARWYLVEIAPGRTQAFARYLQDPDPLVRAELVNALGLSDDARGPRARPADGVRPGHSGGPGRRTCARAAPSNRAVNSDQRRTRGARRESGSASSAVSAFDVVKLPHSFYDRPTLDVARDLIGKVLVHVRRGVRTSGVIVEVEAYIGESDPACHAAPGPTRRNEPLYGPPGYAYVYLNYGIHCLVNVVTEAHGSPAAVLLRALAPARRSRRDEAPSGARHEGPPAARRPYRLPTTSSVGVRAI